MTYYFGKRCRFGVCWVYVGCTFGVGMVYVWCMLKMGILLVFIVVLGDFGVCCRKIYVFFEKYGSSCKECHKNLAVYATIRNFATSNDGAARKR